MCEKNNNNKMSIWHDSSKGDKTTHKEQTIFEAAADGDLDAVAKWLELHQADINQMDPDQRTPLHWYFFASPTYAHAFWIQL